MRYLERPIERGNMLQERGLFPKGEDFVTSSFSI